VTKESKFVYNSEYKKSIVLSRGGSSRRAAVLPETKDSAKRPNSP